MLIERYKSNPISTLVDDNTCPGKKKRFWILRLLCRMLIKGRDPY